MTAVLADTNLLVYAHDSSDPEKHRVAVDVLDHLHSTGSGRLSTQVLAEFFVVVTGGKTPLLTVAKAAQQLGDLAASWIVFDVTPLILIEAVRGVRTHSFSYWDAQLWATARLNQVRVIFSEDFNSGATIAGVLFVNPFSAGFKLTDWQ